MKFALLLSLYPLAVVALPVHNQDLPSLSPVKTHPLSNSFSPSQLQPVAHAPPKKSLLSFISKSKKPKYQAALDTSVGSEASTSSGVRSSESLSGASPMSLYGLSPSGGSPASEAGSAFFMRFDSFSQLPLPTAFTRDQLVSLHVYNTYFKHADAILSAAEETRQKFSDFIRELPPQDFMRFRKELAALLMHHQVQRANAFFNLEEDLKPLDPRHKRGMIEKQLSQTLLDVGDLGKRTCASSSIPMTTPEKSMYASQENGIPGQSQQAKLDRNDSLKEKHECFTMHLAKLNFGIDALRYMMLMVKVDIGEFQQEIQLATQTNLQTKSHVDSALTRWMKRDHSVAPEDIKGMAELVLRLLNNAKDVAKFDFNLGKWESDLRMSQPIMANELKMLSTWLTNATPSMVKRNNVCLEPKKCLF